MENFMTIDIKDFHFNTPMAKRKYMRLKPSNLPKNVVQQYDLEAKEIKDGYVQVEINDNTAFPPNNDAVLTICQNHQGSHVISSRG